MTSPELAGVLALSPEDQEIYFGIYNRARLSALEGRRQQIIRRIIVQPHEYQAALQAVPDAYNDAANHQIDGITVPEVRKGRVTDFEQPPFANTLSLLGKAAFELAAMDLIEDYALGKIAELPVSRYEYCHNSLLNSSGGKILSVNFVSGFRSSLQLLRRWRREEMINCPDMDVRIMATGTNDMLCALEEELEKIET